MVSSTKVFPFGTKSPSFNIDGSAKSPKVITAGDGDFASLANVNYKGAINSFHDFYFLSARGTENAKVKSEIGDTIATWHFSGWDGAAGTPTFATGVTIDVEVDGTINDGSVPANLTVTSSNLNAGTSSSSQLNSDGSINLNTDLSICHRDNTTPANVIDSNPNIGVAVGTTDHTIVVEGFTVDAQLLATADAKSTIGGLDTFSDTAIDAPTIAMRRARGTRAAPTVVTDGTVCAQWIVAPKTSSAVYNQSGFMQFRAVGAPTATAAPLLLNGKVSDVDNATSSEFTFSPDGSVVIRGDGAATLTRVLLLDFASGIDLNTANFTINGGDPFDAISPMTTRGDLITYDGNTKERIPAVAIHNVLLSNGVAMEPIYGKVGLTTHIAGTLPIANGGTGQTTQTAAFDALSPNTTKGDLTVHNSTNNVRLPVGTNGYVMTADSTAAAGVAYKLPSGRIFSKIDDTTVTNTDVETSVLGDIDGTAQLDANSLAIGDTFSMMVTGLIRTHVTNKTISIRIKIGSTVIASKLALALESTALLQYFEIELDNITFRTINAAAQVEAGGQFSYLDTSGSIIFNSADVSNGTDTVDTTVNNAVDVTVEWATAEADNQFVVKTLSFVKK